MTIEQIKLVSIIDPELAAKKLVAWINRANNATQLRSIKESSLEAGIFNLVAKDINRRIATVLD